MHPARRWCPTAIPISTARARPLVRRAPRPALVVRRPVALALHPNKPEIAPPNAVRGIPSVEEGYPQAGADEPIGYCRPD
jgi:hypothetical protein